MFQRKRPTSPVKRHRQTCGLSLGDLASLLAVSVNRISQMEYNPRPPYRRLDEIAALLGTDAATLEREYDAYKEECREYAKATVEANSKTDLVGAR